MAVGGAIRVAVAGASGYAGGELIRLLLAHPSLEIGPLTAHGQAGSLLGDVHPQLGPLAERVLDPTDPALLAEADLVFLALPHTESARVAAALPEHVRVVDLGADHRLVSPEDWQRAYGGEHAGTWPYGLPELPGSRPVIAAATRVAAPGCYPTSVALGLAPLLAAGLVEPVDLVVVAASGTSGAGRSPIVRLLGAEVMGSLTPYKVGGVHQHTPEIEQTLGAAAGAPVTLSFTPVLAPMPRGILATCTARLREGATTESLRAALLEVYAGEPFVRVLPAGQWPATAATLGSNAAQVQVVADPRAGRAVAAVAIDNLGKGAAGQALQCANIMLGLPETSGLTAVGVAP